MSKDCCIAFTQQEEYKVYIQLSTLKLQCIFHVNILTCLYICFDNCCSSSSSISSRLLSIVIALKVMEKPIGITISLPRLRVNQESGLKVSTLLKENQNVVWRHFVVVSRSRQTMVSAMDVNMGRLRFVIQLEVTMREEHLIMFGFPMVTVK